MAVTGTATWEYIFAPSSDGDYVLQARSTDSATNQTSSATTSFSYDSIAPILSIAESVTASSSGGTITWTTGEASSTQVQYGTNNTYGTTTTEADTSTRVTSHSVVLSGLAGCSTFHYRTVSRDSAGNALTGSDQTFTTTGCTGSSSVQAESAGTVTTASGGSVQLQESGTTKVTLTIPTNFSASDAEFQVKRLDKSSVILSASTPTAAKTAIGDHVYQLDALASTTTKTTSFDEPITVTMTYTDAEVAGYDESSLLIYRYDGAAWYELTGCSVDTSANTVSCTTTAFSTFVMFGEESATVTSSSSSSSSSSTSTTSSTTCDDPRPYGKTAWIYGAIPLSSSSIELYFTDADGPISNYVLEYGTKPGVYQYGVDNLGGRGDGYKRYTVQSLTPGTTYYFRVKAVNGCAHGEWSSVKSGKTMGGTTLTSKEVSTEINQPSSCGSYTVQPGDTLWQIAKDQLGDPYRYGELIAANQDEYPSLVADPGLIEAGWSLKWGCPQESQGGQGTQVMQVQEVSQGQLGPWYLRVWGVAREWWSQSYKTILDK